MIHWFLTLSFSLTLTSLLFPVLQYCVPSVSLGCPSLLFPYNGDNGVLQYCVSL